MPRESVRSSNYNFQPIPDGYEPKTGESAYPPACDLSRVEVGWTKAPTGSVEIATVDETMVARLTAQVEKAVVEGDPVMAVVEFFGTSSGLWVHLDRDGINDLIATLRKARDGAYRRDQ